ncbi:MAG: alpha/beta hydrolase [Leptospiraceae bacterium]|nr:alpha/beta hydrolase [Leptospiraceae bacterium]
MNLIRNYFYFKNLKLSYLESGSAKNGTIVLTHANGYSAGCYSYILKHFPDYKICALDFSGHGESESTLNFKNWLFFRDQLLALLQHLEIQEVIGIGHSIGGACWLMASKLISNKVKKLILFDPTLLDIPKILLSKLIGNPLAKSALKRRKNFESLEQVKKIYRKFSAFAKWDEEVFEDYLNTCFQKTENGIELRCAPELEAKIFNSLSVFSPLEYLNIHTESHIIIPQNYQVCSPSTARRIAKGNRKSTVTIMPDFTHFFPFEEKEWTLKKLDSLL